MQMSSYMKWEPKQPKNRLIPFRFYSEYCRWWIIMKPHSYKLIHIFHIVFHMVFRRDVEKKNAWCFNFVYYRRFHHTRYFYSICVWDALRFLMQCEWTDKRKKKKKPNRVVWVVFHKNRIQQIQQTVIFFIYVSHTQSLDYKTVMLI